MCPKRTIKNIQPNESDFAPKIHVSWLYYGDIRIRDTFVNEYTPPNGVLFNKLIPSLPF